MLLHVLNQVPTSNFEESPPCSQHLWKTLGIELKEQTSIAENQFQEIDKIYEFNKKNIDKIKTKKRIKSNLFYSNKFTSFKYHNV